MVDYNTKPEIKTEIVRVEKQDIDLKTLADIVVNAIINKLPSQKGIQINGQEINEDIEKKLTQKTLENLAKSMIVKRENSESNFKNLGSISETQKDIREINKSIDLLKNLDN